MKAENKKWVVVTWHSEWKMNYALSEKNISLEDFRKEVEEEILKNFDKEKFIFRIWWCDWFDNLVWEILIKNWYDYILAVPSFDKNWRDYRSKSEMELFNKIKKNAKRFNSVKWWYYERNAFLAKTWWSLLAFCKSFASWTWQTIRMYHDSVLKHKQFVEILKKWILSVTKERIK